MVIALLRVNCFGRFDSVDDAPVDVANGRTAACYSIGEWVTSFACGTRKK
jgi:hypothetical protein